MLPLDDLLTLLPHRPSFLPPPRADVEIAAGVCCAGLDRVQCHASVMPGDQLELRVQVTHARRRLRKVHADAVVHDRLVCEAELSAVTVDGTGSANQPAR